MGGPGYVETNVAARLDRLPWSKWHWLIVMALGITWVLDGEWRWREGCLGRMPLHRGQPLARLKILEEIRDGDSLNVWI